MSILYILVPLALLLGTGAVLLFLWAVRDGQFEDLETPAVRVLLPDEAPPKGETAPVDGEGDSY